MKKLMLLSVATTVALFVVAQKRDTITLNSSGKKDTIVAGKIIVINKTGNHSTSIDSGNAKAFVIIMNDYKKTRARAGTAWFVLDLGFANFRDNTDYAAAAATGYISSGMNADNFNLNTGNSSNVNLWIFLKRHQINKQFPRWYVKFGVGLEMYNFRYATRINYENDPKPFIFNDSVSFKKNKLALNYVTLPLMLNYTSHAGKFWKTTASAGVSVGYLYNSHDKQKFPSGEIQKTHGNFNLQPWRIAAIAELGYGPVKLYGSYSINNLYQKDETGIEHTPYAFGMRFN